MITSQGMLVCSFNLKQRFSRGEENVYPLNQQYELNLKTRHYELKMQPNFFKFFARKIANLQMIQ